MKRKHLAMNKKKKLLFIIGGSVVVLALALALVIFLIVHNNNQDDDITAPNTDKQSEHTEQMNNNSDKNMSEENRNNTDSSSANSSNSTSANSTTTYQQSTQQTSNTNATNDESNLPLCQRTHLSYEEAQRCADEIRQRMDEEERQRQEEFRAKWCAENMPGIYDRYNSQLISENQRYKSEINNYIRSHIGSGAPGDEATHREIAEKTYSPLHIQLVNSIVSNYIKEAQSHGCDVSGYNL